MMHSPGMSFQPAMFRLPSFQAAVPAARFAPSHPSPAASRAPASPAGNFVQLRLGPNFVSGPSFARAQAFSPMKEEAVSSSLSAMKMPLTKENVALAKTMVQSGVPLTKANMESLKTSLSSLPSVSNSDMQAASFLKSASLPQTSGNITSLSSFIASNPHVGTCIFEFNREFRKMASGGRKGISEADMKILSKSSSILGSMVMDAKADPKANARAFRRMGGSSGMNLPHFMMGTRDDELDSMMLELRKLLLSEKSQAGEEMKQAFLKLEDALAAQRLINSGKREGLENFFYFQLPVVFGDETLTAEFKLFYTTDYKGRKSVDPDNFEFEFCIPSSGMGNVLFAGAVKEGVISIKAGFEEQRICDFAGEFLPCLMERLQNAGFAPGGFSAEVRVSEEQLPMAIDDGKPLESVDMSF